MFGSSFQRDGFSYLQLIIDNDEKSFKFIQNAL